MKPLFRKLTLATMLGLATLPNAQADSIFKGVRGPTDWQYDDRVSYAERETAGAKTQTIANSSILKYWNGNKLGVFGFANLPVKEVSKGNLSSEGLGDIALGLGPRGKVPFGKGSFNFLSYAGAVLPTGDSKSAPALGTGRIDPKFGLFTTYLSQKGKFEIDGSIEYLLTGRDTKGNPVSDELSLGLVAGRQISPKLRLVGGLTGTLKLGAKNDGDYSFGPRIDLRYTPSKRWHTEVMADVYSLNNNMPKGYGITGIVRINLGKLPGK